MFFVCIMCNKTITVGKSCPNCGHHTLLASMCFAVREEKDIIFPECNSCEHRYICFTERSIMDCGWVKCKQVILADGQDSDEVWCSKREVLCTESPESCKYKDEPYQVSYNEDDWRKDR